MRIYTSDEKKSVDVGMGSIWHSIYSTVSVAFTADAKNGIPLAMAFLKSGECSAENENPCSMPDGV